MEIATRARGQRSARGGASVTAGRPTIYCVIPRELANELHEPLRDHFRSDPHVKVIVDFRNGDRRANGDRRGEVAAPADDRRRIRSETGRRVSERRALTVALEPLDLPRKARRHLDRIGFFERLEPTSQRALDADNARLVMRFQAGEQSAFTDLYMRNFDSVYTYLRVALKDHHEAEDAAQQVFINTLEALPRFELRRGKPFRAWLFRIARNQALTHLRKQRNVDVEDPEDLDRRRQTVGEMDSDRRALEWLTDTELLILIERLPVAQRQAITLRYMLGLTTEEMATALDRSTMAVRKLEHRALRFLEQRLIATGRKPLNTDRSAMKGLNRTPLETRPLALAPTTTGVQRRALAR